MVEELVSLQPTRRVLVSDSVIEQIRNLILEGRLSPGDALPSEMKMASQMNVGRSTIREALKVLIHLGLLERRQKVAVVSENVRDMVFPYDLVDRFEGHRNLFDMMEVRKMIEPDMAGLAAIRAEPRDIDQIRQDTEAMEQSTDDRDAFVMHDHHFHVHVAEASKNRVLIDIVEAMRENLARTQGHVLLKSKDILPRSLEFHRKILRALAGQKLKLARKQMLDHLLDIENELYTILKREDGAEARTIPDSPWRT